MRCAVLLLSVASVLAVQNVRGQDAVWVGGNGGDPGEWVESNNWSPNTVPTGVATFTSTGVTSIANDNGGVTINEVLFTATPNAQAYTISVDNAFILTGVGVINNSTNTQNFTINDTLIFNNSSSASGGTGLVSYSNSGFIYFQDSSTAGSGTFTNNEIMQFSGSSTAASANITNNIELDFFDNTSAANAVITNSSEVTFNNSSTAANATITNTGTVQFLNSATAGSAIITTNSGGEVTFTGSSTGGQAQFIVNTSGSFDMSGLTSGSMTAGSISGGGDFYLGSKTLIVGGSDLSGTVSGVISDGGFSGGTGGALVKVGSGTLTLNGDNTYTGGTTLEAGTLTVGSDSALGTGTLTITGGTLSGTGASNVSIGNNIAAEGDFFIAAPAGVFYLTGTMNLEGAAARTITVSNAYDQIYLDGVITNGGLTLSSTYTSGDGGVFWMEGSLANTYTGLTTVDHNITLMLAGSVANGTIIGNVQINQDGVLFDNGGGTAQIAQSSTVTVNSTGNVTRFGTLAGFDLNGNNETIAGLYGTGNVQLNDGQIDGTSTTKAGTLTVGSGSFSGVISDAGFEGGLVKTGTGVFIVTGANTYDGPTFVNGGVLQLDGTLSSVNTQVNAGGTLGGTGQVVDLYNNGGNVAPGNATPGMLTISGDYNQTSAGTLTIRVGGVAAGQHDLLSVAGGVELGGTLQLVRLNNFSLQSGDKIVILTAGTPITGTFSTVTTNTLLDAKVVYDPEDVALEFSSSSFVIPGLTPNQTAVARNLDVVASGTGAGSPLITFLDNEPLGNLPHDYDLIAPEELTAIFQISEALSDVQAGNIENHLTEVRGSDISFATTTVGLLADGKSTVDAKDEGGKNVPTPATPENRWNLWSNGSGDFVRVQGDGNGSGYNFTTGGVTLGADYRVCDHFVVGLMGGYANTGATLTQGGAVDVNGGSVGIYSTAFGNGFYLNTLASGGYNSYDTHRTALGGIAQGDTDGAEFDGLIGGGYDFHSGNWTVGPMVSARYTYVGLNGFNENGSLAPLHIESQNQDSFRTLAGFKVSSDWNIAGVKVTPMVTAGWQHEYLDSTFALDSQFANGAGNVFTVDGPKLGRDSAVVNAGVGVQWTERVGTYLFYDGELGRKNYELNSVSGGVKIGF